MELFRSLAFFAEAAGSEAEPAVAALELGEAPTASEFTDLFEFQLYPYASVYLSPEGMLGGEARDRIAGFWRALGEAPPPEPDHLAVLLAAYAALVDRERETGKGDSHSRWRHARSAFLWEHLLSWLPVYLGRIAEIGSSFYRGWGEILSEALFEEAESLDLPERLPLHLREATALGDLEDAGSDEFLRAITTPVRAGMILVRSDLERCARRLDLGLRKGERRYVLKSLLGQMPGETLEWLADEAERQAATCASGPSSIRPLLEFWRERAQATAAVMRHAATAVQT